jgi:hypothetical protein
MPRAKPLATWPPISIIRREGLLIPKKALKASTPFRATSSNLLRRPNGSIIASRPCIIMPPILLSHAGAAASVDFTHSHPAPNAALILSQFVYQIGHTPMAAPMATMARTIGLASIMNHGRNPPRGHGCPASLKHAPPKATTAWPSGAMAPQRAATVEAAPAMIAAFPALASQGPCGPDPDQRLETPERPRTR